MAGFAFVMGSEEGPRLLPFLIPLPQPQTGVPSRGLPGVPRLLPRLPGGLPDLNPNPRPGDSGDYWSVPNQLPGGPAMDGWEENWSQSFTVPTTVVLVTRDFAEPYTRTRCSDGGSFNESGWDNSSTRKIEDVLSIRVYPKVFTNREICGSGQTVESYGFVGLHVVVQGPSGAEVVQTPTFQPISRTSYGDWRAKQGGSITYLPQSFGGEPAVRPSPVPEYWPGRGFPDRPPEIAPAPEAFVPDGPFGPTAPPKRKAPPVPLVPSAPPNSVPVPVPAPPRVPAPIPPQIPQEKPGTSPRVQPKPAPAPGTSPAPGPGPAPALPEVTPDGLPQPLPVPVPQTPSWQETFLGRPIGQPASRDRATLPEIARQTGKLEQKSVALGEQQQSGGLDPELVDLLKELWERLNSSSPGGAYLLSGPCERNPDGSPMAPVAVEWPRTPGPIEGVSAKIDALAALLQVHKTMGQPACVKERQGKPVTVILREVR